MLELAWQGTRPVALNNGTSRTAVEDNDTVTLKGYCRKNELRIGFGEVTTKLLPAHST
jgi:fumarylacetoacetase